jgi:hypothetical protein
MKISRRSIAASGLGGAATLAAPRVILPGYAANDPSPADAVEAFRKAMLARDHAALDALCAFQLSYGHANGAIQTKEEFITAATSGQLIWKTLEFTNARSTVVGPNAISRFTLNGDVEIDGKVRSTSIGVMTVWQKQGDDWRLLARQGFKPEA